MIAEARQFISRLSAYGSGYDAVKGGKKRRQPNATTRHEDKALKGADRRRSVGSLRSLHRNFAIVAWAVRKHLDYVSQFDFQMRTESEDLNNDIERRMRVWSRPGNCDITGRYPFAKMLRLFESRRTVDNDVFALLLRSGHLQAIEGDRIQDPPQQTIGQDKWYHGVKVNRAGRPIGFALHNRTDASSLEYDRTLSASNVIQHGYFERFDQYRGISPLNAAVNSFQDTYEGIDLALAKMKVEQLFALVFARDAQEGAGYTTEDGDGYNVDFGTGPIQLDLEPGDTAQFLKSDNPGSNTREFLHVVIGIAIKALDLPFNFYDESHTNFFGSRAAWLLYDRSCQAKRADVLEFLRRVTVWRLRYEIVNNGLILPEGMTIADINFEWVPRGMPWWDPVKEINGNIQAMKAGLDNPYRICKETGRGDFEENIDAIARATQYAADRGVSLEFAMQTVIEVPPDGSTDSN